jgi:hypothetical protein
MNKHFILGCSLAAFISPCLLKAQTNPAPVVANPYYNIKVNKSKTSIGLPYQAFATGRKGDTILLLTGRTNGFHNFPAPPVASFPSNRSNDTFVVFIPSQNKVYKAGVTTLLTPIATTINPNTSPVVTTNQLYQLASTNIQSCQSGDTLYCIGGYGYNGSMVTFGGCFAINVPRMIDLIIKGGSTSSTTIKKALSFSTNPDLPTSFITGGELLKTNKGYYLVVGQRFDGEYSNGSYASNNPTGFKQNYTCTITPYSFAWSSDSTFSCASGSPYTDFNNLHRRDLNVVPIINSKGTKSFHIYGGVFTVPGGPYLSPIEVTDTTGTITIQVDNVKQYFNQYAAAHLSIFDAKNNQMFTTMLGGITLYDSVANSQNNSGLLPPSNDTTMPWSKVVSTMVKNNTTGAITEYASDNSRLNEFIGGEAKFVAFKQFLLNGSDEIMDMNKVKAAARRSGGSVKVGIMIGGIVSQLAQTQVRSQTQTNSNIYDVSLTPVK